MDGDIYIDVDCEARHFPFGSTPTAEEKLHALKLEMADCIRYEYRFRKAKHGRFLQKQFAHEVGMTQPEISDILRGRLERFAIDRLMLILIRCGLRPYIDWCGTWFESRPASGERTVQLPMP